MLNNLPLLLPPIKNLGKDYWDTSKYYRWPFRAFYLKKFYMIRDMMDKGEYESILDYGTGSGVFLRELNQYTDHLKGINHRDALFERQFELIVCGSVLEFTDLAHTLAIIDLMLQPNGELVIASPMTTWKTNLYYKLIRNKEKRHHHEDIIREVGKMFYIEDIQYWKGLYFAMRARKR